MVKVTFITSSGNSRTVEESAGTSVMEAAVNNGITGILAECGGAMACATCHVHVRPEWWEKVGPPDTQEASLLDGALEVDETSRLSCQIELSDELDGLVVTLPASQI